MRTRSKGFELRTPAPKARLTLTAADAAKRLGVTVDELEALARQWWLEPTYTLEEVAKHFRQGKWQMNELVQLGLTHGAQLHPTRGGFHPTFKPSHKSRVVPLSAIERHKRHMARAHDGAAA